MPTDPIPDSRIVLRIPRPLKGRYVAAARAEGMTLAAWVLAHLDAASAHMPPFPEPGAAAPADPANPRPTTRP